MNMMVSAAALASAASIQPADASHNLDAELDALWLEREDLMRSNLTLREQLDRAYEKLPEWANCGYSQLDSEGNKCGHVSGWPEIANLPDNSGGPAIIMTIRPSPRDYKERLRTEADVFGRKAAIAGYKRRMRAFIARRREQTRMWADLGITEVERQLEQRADRDWDIGSAINGLPPSINQALAAAIIEAGHETLTGCTANDPTEPFVGVFRLAQLLRSLATGSVRASIDRIFDNPDETLEDLAILPF